MNRSELVRAVSGKEELPITVVEQVVGSLLEIITLCLATGEEVNLRRFGKIEPRVRKPVVRKNPRTGVDIPVPEKVSVGFVPSQTLKKRLNPSD